MEAAPSPYAVGPLLWAELEPVAVEADRRERRPTRVVAAVLAVLVVGLAAVFVTGVWTPNVTTNGAGSAVPGDNSKAKVVDIYVTNRSVLPLTVAGSASYSLAGPTHSVAGLEVIEAHTEQPIAAGADGSIRFTLKLTDCSRIGSGNFGLKGRLTVTAQTWHGPESVTLSNLWLYALVDEYCA